MFMFEVVALKGVREHQPAELVEDMATLGLASAELPARRRAGYPGCRHFNENYIGSWLRVAAARQA
jgi:hypothetical protein